MRARYFLSLAGDCLDRAEPYHTRKDAIHAFAEVARELDRYGQSITASLHIALARDELVEYPDFVLELGPRGGVRVTSA